MPATLLSDDDDWGDFVIGSQIPPPDPIANPNPSSRKGAIPLSVFGFDDDEEDEPEEPAEAEKREEKDPVPDLYGHVAVGEDEEDDDGWEFQDAFSAPVVDDGNEEQNNDFFELEKKGVSGDNAIQVVDNRLETVYEPFGQHIITNGGRHLEGAYAANGSHTNGLQFDLNVIHRQIVPDTSQNTVHTENINSILHPRVETGVGMQMWNFSDAFSKNVEIPDTSKKIDHTENLNNALHRENENGVGMLWDFNDAISKNVVMQDTSSQIDHTENINNILDSSRKNGMDMLTWDFSDASSKHMIPDTTKQKDQLEDISNILHPEMGNGVDTQMWDFSDAFSESVVVNGFLEQKTTDADPDMFESTDKGKIQDSTSLWESNPGSHQASGDDNEKQDLSWSSEKSTISFQEPNVGGRETKDLMFRPVIALDDIMSLYNETGQSHSIPDSASLNGESCFGENDWEFQAAPETAVSDINSSCKTDGTLTRSPQNPDLSLYSKLKEKLLSLMDDRLEDLKKAQEDASLSGEPDKAIKSNGDTQLASKELEGAVVSENMHMGKHQTEYASNQMVDLVDDPHFQAFEQEYNLFERIQLAEKDLSVATELLEHVTSVLHILELASKEEQQIYINAWSKIGAACAKELQHGALIWTESLAANISEQILSRGHKYFLALGEIYRVSLILKASLQLYKPWILSSQETSSRELITSLDKCAEAWTASGLAKSVENITDTTYLQSKSLLELNEATKDLSIQNNAFAFDDTVCRLSLLPVGRLKGLKLVAWNGDQYCVNLANMWANRVSPDPPHLPCIFAS